MKLSIAQEIENHHVNGKSLFLIIAVCVGVFASVRLPNVYQTCKNIENDRNHSEIKKARNA